MTDSCQSCGWGKGTRFEAKCRASSETDLDHNTCMDKEIKGIYIQYIW